VGRVDITTKRTGPLSEGLQELQLWNGGIRTGIYPIFWTVK